MLRKLVIVTCIVVLGALCPAAYGDLFKFKDGRVVYGTVVSPVKLEKVGNSETKVWTVDLGAGVFARIRGTDLIRNGHEPLSEDRKSFVQEAQTTPLELDALKDLAEFCGRNRLSDLQLAIRHYCVDLDPTDSPSRVAAGYKQDINGRWRKTEEIMVLDRGKVKHRGRWEFPEALVIARAKEEQKALVVAATTDIRRWHGDVTRRGANASTPRYQNAMRGLRQIQNPLATALLVEYLQDADVAVALKLNYIRVLSSFKNPTAAVALAQAAMTDVNAEVRGACMAELHVYGSNFAASVFLSYLGNAQNGMVNRAADGLAELGASHTILQLIPYLRTKHVVDPGGGGMNADAASGSFGAGKRAARSDYFNNRSVHSALSQFTNQSLGYDSNAWLGWYASVHAAPVRDLRRDN